MAQQPRKNMTRDDAKSNEDLLRVLELNLADPFDDESANALFRKLRDDCLVIKRLDTLRVTEARREEVEKLVDRMCNTCVAHCAQMRRLRR